MKKVDFLKLVTVFGVAALLTISGCTNKQADVPGEADNAADEAEADAAPANTVTTDSGLVYEVLEAGDGPKPGPADSVTVHYRGTLLDGKEFDSSYSRGKPATFGVSRVIKGWTEALQLMGVGSKWKLTIPPELAYGKRGAGRDIGPDETLVFEVELLKIN
ncbi:MAG TPA: FKBP-type peptidyl-prolyl cis-trans isomerase [Deltaproteobacteria bacterium]|nr:FKBP-type peptidyl-prolyl cis-trans isomerase [Candidatus Binatota bacterium]HIL12522.1 FKBP-type peptidyl-prolyl cis-trans isomerase [Deltaproteobacteria bacterium]